MGHFESIKAAIDAKVNTNGRQAITGHILNNILHGMLDSIDVALADEVKKILGDVSLDYDTLKEIADYIAIDKGRYEAVVAALNRLSQTDKSLSETITTLTKDISQLKVADTKHEENVARLIDKVNFYVEKLEYLAGYIKPQSSYVGYGRLGYSIIGGSRENAIGFAKIGYAMIG